MQILQIPAQIQKISLFQIIQKNSLIHRNAAFQNLRHPVASFSDIQDAVQKDAPDLHLSGLSLHLIRAEFSLSVDHPEDIRLLIRYVQILFQRDLAHSPPSSVV